MVAHSGKVAGAAEGAAGLRSPVCRVPFGQMRGREHIPCGLQPFQDGTAVYLFPFSLEFNGAGSIIPPGDRGGVGDLVVEIPHRHDAPDAFRPERIYQAPQPQHCGFPSLLRAFAHLGGMMVDQYGKALLPFAEYCEEDVPRGHDGAGAVVQGTGPG